MRPMPPLGKAAGPGEAGVSIVEVLVAAGIGAIIATLAATGYQRHSRAQIAHEAATSAASEIAELAKLINSRFVGRLRMNPTAPGVELDASNPCFLRMRTRADPMDTASPVKMTTLTTQCETVAAANTIGSTINLGTVPTSLCAGASLCSPSCSGRTVINVTEDTPASGTARARSYPPTTTLRQGLPLSGALCVSTASSPPSGSTTYSPAAGDLVVSVAESYLDQAGQLKWTVKRLGLILVDVQNANDYEAVQ